MVSSPRTAPAPPNASRPPPGSRAAEAGVRSRSEGAFSRRHATDRYGQGEDGQWHEDAGCMAGGKSEAVRPFRKRAADPGLNGAYLGAAQPPTVRGERSLRSRRSRSAAKRGRTQGDVAN